MDGSTAEDWERAWLMDRLYIQEMEMQEMEHFDYEAQKPAIIKVLIPQLKDIKNQPKLLKNEKI